MAWMLEIKDKAVIVLRHVWSSLSSSGAGVDRKDSFNGGAGLGCPGGMEEMGKE